MSAAADEFFVPWSPLIIRWNCVLLTSGETKCSNYLFGLLPAMATTPSPDGLKAFGAYRVMKATAGPVAFPLTVGVSEAPCTIAGVYITCVATDVVTLAPGITQTFGSGFAENDLTIQGSTPAPLFDWDGDGLQTADREGLMLSRYLMGFRGTAVTAGIPLTGNKTPETVNGEITNAVQQGWFNFIAPSTAPTGARESLLFSRCLRGLRGGALVGSIAQAVVAETETRCDGLRAIE